MNKKLPRVNVVTLGCSKNLVDSEVLLRQLDNQYEVRHNDDKDSDIVIINTCGFIHDAKQESIDTILTAVEAKKSGHCKKVVVTGCLSQRYKKELKDEIKEVDGFFGVDELPEILKSLNVDYKKELIGERMLTTPSHFAYLKISEGCDRSCAFCAIPLIRGKHISQPIDKLIKEARLLADKGVKELLLIAQDLTYYGIDLYHKREIASLVEQLAAIDEIKWIRMHYAYPAGFPEELLTVVNNNPKICKYLDIPLQHINSRILKSMKRGLDEKGTRELIYKIRSSVPGIALRSTFIVGYPGETESEFQQLLDFISEVRFERLGVFQYSPEEDTSAFNLADDVPDDVKDDRESRLMDLQRKISNELNAEKIGKKIQVLIDRKEGDFFVGRSEFDSPEVDNEVLITSDNFELKTGGFYFVEITGSEDYDLFARIPD